MLENENGQMPVLCSFYVYGCSAGTLWADSRFSL